MLSRKKSDTTVLLAKKIQNICITASCEKFKKAFFYKVGVRSFSNYAESENQKETLFFIFIVRTFSLFLWSAILATAAVCFVCPGAVSRNWYLQMPGIHHNCFRSVLL